MNLHRLLATPRPSPTGRMFGVVLGVVTNNQDPDKLGRVKVKFPWLAGNEESSWAPVIAGGGSKHGVFVLPEVGDQVLLALELGDIDRPFVLGGVWSTADPPPTGDGDGRDRKVFRSKAGHVIRIDDTSGSEKIEILDKTGKNTFTIDSSTNTITIAAENIVLKAREKVSLEAKDLEVKASGSAKVEASGTLTLKGSTVNVN